MSDTGQCGELFGSYSVRVDGRMQQIRCTKQPGPHQDHEYPPLGLHWHVGLEGALYVSTPVRPSSDVHLDGRTFGKFI
jgi:hypothetical protein